MYLSKHNINETYNKTNIYFANTLFINGTLLLVQLTTGEPHYTEGDIAN